ncbi:MAG: DUF6569 family protein [Candidatus Obscuribacterales bacterium]
MPSKITEPKNVLSRQKHVLLTTLCLTSSTLFASPSFAQTAPMPPLYQISQPYSNGNLSVFLIKGASKSKTTEYLTLPEALAKKQVTVHETGDVNLLKIDNLSSAAVFIQSGEIVKGGRQDRALQVDMVIPPHAQQVSLPCFCVEHGRWSARVGENSSNFGSASDFVVGNNIHKAIKKDGDQSQVWAQVQAKQDQLARTLTKPVAAGRSPSSLQLTLEEKSVKEATQNQFQALSTIVDKDRDAIGYVVAINGKVNNADIYGSSNLFKKLWPGLLKAAVIEAVAQRGQQSAKLPNPNDLKKTLSSAEHFKRVPTSIGYAPALQGATNGAIGPQGQDALVITGVNTAGSVRSSSPMDYFSQTTDRKSGAVIHQNFLGF